MERLELKAAFTADDSGVIEGIAWPFGAPDRAGDEILPAAFAGAVGKRLPMLAGHSVPVGAWDHISVDGDGLKVKGRLLIDDVPEARSIRALAKEGVMALSVGFLTKKSTPRKGGGRTISDLDLVEVSIVAVPANAGARITNAKDLNLSTETENQTTIDVAEIEAKAVSAAEAKAAEAVEALKDRLAALETKANRPAGKVDKDEQAEVERKALASFLRTGSDVEIKAAASDNDPAGGYMVLPTMDMSIRSLMTDISPMRSIAEVVTISTSHYERFYSLGKRGAQRVSERDDRPHDTARPELIKQAYGVGEYYAAPVATRHLLDDAATDIASWLINNAVHDFAETEGEDFLFYDGTDGFPRGLLDYGTTNEKDFVRAWGKHQYVPAGHASAPTDANLVTAIIKLVAALRKPYKGNARFLMNSTTAVRLQTIEDQNGRRLWAPTGNLIEGVEHPLLGYPVEIDENMPDIAAGEHPVAFGDFRQGYVIVDRQGVRINRDELTQKGRVVFDTYKRTGGGAGDFNAIKFLKVAAT